MIHRQKQKYMTSSDFVTYERNVKKKWKQH